MTNLKDYFKNNESLTLALTHRSYLNEHPEATESNERLEFLGDSILSFLVSRYLYLKYPHHDEGTLTNLRTKLVQTATLARLSRELGVGERLRLSRGEETNDGRSNPTLLANTFEAILGALLVDQDLKACEKFLDEMLLSRVSTLFAESPVDAKSTFQEKVQADGHNTPTYETIAAQGPDHAKIFTVVVKVDGKTMGKGNGRSKQEAEQKAALAALKIYKSTRVLQ